MATDDGRSYAETVDVREIDGEPFDDITNAVSALERDETMLLIAPFEPIPLYGVLEERGLAYESTQVEPDEFRVEITHG